MSSLRLSVIVPVYNVAEVLGRTLESLLRQDIDDYEIILVDDGSTDGSGEICDEYAAKYGNISVIHQPNGGVSAARNAGLDAARGEYVHFMDSDDVLAPGTYGYLLDTFGPERPDYINFRWRFARADSYRPEEGALTEQQLRRGTPERMTGLEMMARGEFMQTCWQFIVRRGFIEEHRLRFDPGQIVGEDYTMLLKILGSNPRCVVTQSPYYLYLIRPGSLSQKKTPELIDRWMDSYDILIRVNSELLRRCPQVRPGLEPKVYQMLYAYLSALLSADIPTARFKEAAGKLRETGLLPLRCQGRLVPMVNTLFGHPWLYPPGGPGVQRNFKAES